MPVTPRLLHGNKASSSLGLLHEATVWHRSWLGGGVTLSAGSPVLLGWYGLLWILEAGQFL